MPAITVMEKLRVSSESAEPTMLTGYAVRDFQAIVLVPRRPSLAVELALPDSAEESVRQGLLGKARRIGIERGLW